MYGLIQNEAVCGIFWPLKMPKDKFVLHAVYPYRFQRSVSDSNAPNSDSADQHF